MVPRDLACLEHGERMKNRQTHGPTEISGFGYIGLTGEETIAIWKAQR